MQIEVMMSDQHFFVLENEERMRLVSNYDDVIPFVMWGKYLFNFIILELSHKSCF